MKTREPGFPGGGQTKLQKNTVNKINKGPEVYSEDSLHVEYSRSERLASTRFVDGRQRTGRRKYSLKILMLDILLLCIIGGVLYPFIESSNKKGTLDNVHCRLSLRTIDDEFFISVNLHNRNTIDEEKIIDLQIMVNEQLVYEASDLIPSAGNESTFRFKMKRHKEKLAVHAILTLGEESIDLNALSPASAAEQ